jgi:hypothetical protein
MLESDCRRSPPSPQYQKYPHRDPAGGSGDLVVEQGTAIARPIGKSDKVVQPHDIRYKTVAILVNADPGHSAALYRRHFKRRLLGWQCLRWELQYACENQR